MARPSKGNVIRIRIKAVRLHTDGFSHQDIAEYLSISDTIVRKWVKAYEKEGVRALIKPDLRGGQSKLTQADVDRLVIILKKGAIAEGYQDNRWTIKRVHAVILRTFQVNYSLKNINKLLEKKSCQIPDSRTSYTYLSIILKMIERHDAKEFGYKSSKWTVKRVRATTLLIFKVEYKDAQIQWYMNKNGWFFNERTKTSKP